MSLTAERPWSDSAVQRDQRAAEGQECLALLRRLAQTLAAAGVQYCQWKGQFKRERWAHGVGDIDLLIARESAGPFFSVLADLGFKLTTPPAAQSIAGVSSYIGMDIPSGKLVHLHVHWSLVIGSLWRTMYRVPLERVTLKTVVPTELFPVPAPAIEYVLFVLRQVQRYKLRDALRAPRWLAAVQAERRFLERRGGADSPALDRLLAEHLPQITPEFVQRAARSLTGRGTSWRRPLLHRELQRRLGAHESRSAPRLLTRLTVAFQTIVPENPPRSNKHVATGGAIIALAGADGAGKSTCARALLEWLSPFVHTTHAQLGKPRRSLRTLVVGALLKLARLLEWCSPVPAMYAHQLRNVATASDRYRLYKRVRALAQTGALVICERYPVRADRLVGPAIPDTVPAGVSHSRLTRLLIGMERRYYERMLPPDLLLVLQVDAPTAVRRKTTEPAEYVRERADLAFAADWTQSSARVVDASGALEHVLAQLRACIWRVI